MLQRFTISVLMAPCAVKAIRIQQDCHNMDTSEGFLQFGQVEHELTDYEKYLEDFQKAGNTLEKCK